MQLGHILNQLRRERDHVAEMIEKLERSATGNNQAGRPQLFLVENKSKPDNETYPARRER